MISRQTGPYITATLTDGRLRTMADGTGTFATTDGHSVISTMRRMAQKPVNLRQVTSIAADSSKLDGESGHVDNVGLRHGEYTSIDDPSNYRANVITDLCSIQPDHVIIGNCRPT